MRRAAKIIPMKRKIGLALASCTLLVAGLLAAVYSGKIPLGVPGEWEWLRVKSAPPLLGLLIASAGVAAYGGYAALGFRALGVPSRIGLRESSWVAGLAASAAILQALIPMGAADEYDLAKWAYVHGLHASTGYYQVAKEQAAADPWRFLADYPTWIQAQDSLHIGTHPPGLIAMHCTLIAAMERHRRAADALNAAMPPPVSLAFRQLEVINRRAVPHSDRAAMFLASLITLFACAGTVAPLYVLARESLPPQVAWASASLWPLATAANLFQPGADAAYPMLSAAALAAAAWSARITGTPGLAGWGSPLLAIGSGAVMAFGMMFTLAFLPIGLIAALIVLSTRSISWPRRFGVVAWIGVGFLAIVALGWLTTGADPITVWRWNLRHHARFYLEYPRTYLAWLLENPVELAVAAGLPAAFWCIVGAVGDRRYVPRAAWCTLGVLVVVNLTGRNMGETARLWMLFLPPLFTAAGLGLTRLGGGTRTLFATVLLAGLQTLGLQAMIQVVYPI